MWNWSTWSKRTSPAFNVARLMPSVPRITRSRRIRHGPSDWIRTSSPPSQSTVRNGPAAMITPSRSATRIVFSVSRFWRFTRGSRNGRVPEIDPTPLSRSTIWQVRSGISSRIRPADAPARATE